MKTMNMMKIMIDKVIHFHSDGKDIMTKTIIHIITITPKIKKTHWSTQISIIVNEMNQQHF
jgi:hypothetical protein